MWGRSTWAMVLILAGSVPAVGQMPSGEPSAAGPAVEVRVDPRIELFSVIFRLAGHPEYNQGLVDRYTAAVEHRFRRFANHPAVALARQLRRDDGISYDAVPSLAVHVTAPPELAERMPLAPMPESLERRWRPATARHFLQLARDFASRTHFMTFYREQETLWNAMVQQTQLALHDEAKLEWFDRFFGTPFRGTYVVSLGMLNGPRCYAARFSPSGASPELHCVLGAWATDEQGTPRFDSDMIGIVIHEFVHSYVNPIVDAHAESLQRPAEIMLRWVEPAMKDQAYGTWRIMMYESVVRACVIHYMYANDGKDQASAELQRDRERQFLWIQPLFQKIGSFDPGKRHATFDSFFPQIVAFFRDYAPKFDAERAARAKRVPKIVTMTPANGTMSVDPATDKITIVFDRDMDTGSWSVVGQGPQVPSLPAHVYYADNRTFVIPVSLRRAWDYTFSLNSQRFHGFKSAEGVPMDPVPVTYRTRQ